MRRLNGIVESAFPPNTTDVWLYKGNAKYFTNGTWTSIGNNDMEVLWKDISGKPTFSKVATSGSYADLSNTPTSYVLPRASLSTIGGVLKSAAVPVLPTDAELSAVITAYNSLVNNLKTAGIIS